MTVVCVDDHRILLNGITETVKQTLPYASINSFVSANKAFAFAKGNGCDILICEIDLHDMSGITLAKQIKKLNPKVNIIFVTVCSESEHAKAVMRLKPSGYLTKEATSAQVLEELLNLRYPVS